VPVGDNAPSCAKDTLATKCAAATKKLVQPIHRGSASPARIMMPIAADEKIVMMLDTFDMAAKRSHINRTESASTLLRYAALEMHASAAAASVNVAIPKLRAIVGQWSAIPDERRP
jgi:hypothetical protein